MFWGQKGGNRGGNRKTGDCQLTVKQLEQEKKNTFLSRYTKTGKRFSVINSFYSHTSRVGLDLRVKTKWQQTCTYSFKLVWYEAVDNHYFHDTLVP